MSSGALKPSSNVQVANNSKPIYIDRSQPQETRMTSRERLIWVLTVLYIFTSLFGSTFVVPGRYLLFALTLLTLFFSGIHAGAFLKLEPYQKRVGLFVLFCFMTVFWATNSTYALYKSITVLSLFLCNLVFYLYYKKKKSIDMLLYALIWAGYIAVFYSIFFIGMDNIIHEAQEGGRLATGLQDEFISINTLGMFFAVCVNLSVFFWLNKGFRYEYLMLFPCAAGCFLTGCRKAFVLLVLGIFFIFIYNAIQKKKPQGIIRSFVFLFVVVILTGALWNTFVFKNIKSRVEQIGRYATGDESADGSTRSRMRLIEIGWDVFKSHPILGVGVDNGRIYSAREQGSGVESYFHNNYIELLADGGIVGFSIYYAIYGWLLVRFYKRWKLSKGRSDIYDYLVVILILINLILDYGLVSYYGKLPQFYFVIYFLQASKKLTPRRGTSLASNYPSRRDRSEEGDRSDSSERGLRPVDPEASGRHHHHHSSRHHHHHHHHHSDHRSDHHSHRDHSGDSPDSRSKERPEARSENPTAVRSLRVRIADPGRGESRSGEDSAS